MSRPPPRNAPITDRIWMDWFSRLVSDSAWKLRSGNTNPTVADISANEWIVWKNTAANEVRVWVNDGGTLKKSAAFT